MEAMSELKIGDQVVTERPAIESSDWTPEAAKARRWGVKARIVKLSNSHGLCFQVEYEDGMYGWHETWELKLEIGS